jgi:hypothetical protein
MKREKATERFGVYEQEELVKLRLPDVRSFDPSDREAMQALRRLFDIGFTISGKVVEDRRDHFRMVVTSTSDGRVVLDHEYRDTETSDGLGDAVRLFTEGKVPEYGSRSGGQRSRTN